MTILMRCVICSVLGCCLIAGQGSEPVLIAQVDVPSASVFVGIPFLIRVHVFGRPSPPDTSGVRDFAIEPVVKEWDDSRAQTTFTYRLRALREGELEIPPLPVRAGSLSTRTPRVALLARQPDAGSASLALELSDPCCFVGQQVVARFTFRHSHVAENLHFDIPFLVDDRLAVILLNSGFLVGRQPGFVRARVNDTWVAASLAEDGASASVEMVLIPRRVGTIVLPSVSAWFSVGDEKVLATFAGTSLEVTSLPKESRPASFSGLVGQYSLVAAAEPRDVRLGDPISLNLTLGGQPFLDEARIPRLTEETALVDDFQVTWEPDQPTEGGAERVFRYTLRPRTDGVSQIPPLKYSYFDTSTGCYVEEHTATIPIRVTANEQVVAEDAERSEYEPPAPPVPRSQLAGIAHNYEGADLLANREIALVSFVTSPLWLGAMALPPLLFFSLLASKRWTGYRIRLRRRGCGLSALEVLERELYAAESGAGGCAVESFRRYVASRLRLPPRSMTFSDVKARCEGGLVTPQTLAEIKVLFDQEDAIRYGAGSRRTAAVNIRAREIARQLDAEVSDLQR